MVPLVLRLDDSLEYQAALGAAAEALGGRFVHAEDLGPDLRLWSRRPALLALGHRLRQHPPRGPEVTFAGSGDFHHMTPILLVRAMEAAGQPEVTVIHLDNHPDWVKFEDGMHCGSWVADAARLPKVARVITVGVCSRDIDRPRSKGADLSLVEEGRVEVYPYRTPDGRPSLSLCGQEWTSIETAGEADFIELLMGRIVTDAVYLTIDKDVLRTEDAATNWDQGRMSLDFLERLVERVAEKHRLIGADVVGDWSTPQYGGGVMAAWLKRGEAMMDQPRRPADIAAARRLNEITNLRLLDLFQRVSR